MNDSISRQAAIDAVKDRYYKYGRFANVEELVWSIEKLPPAQPERIRGRWVKSMGMNPPEYAGRYQCSECGEWAMRDIKHFKQDLTKFCPHCGAEMRDAQDA